MAVGYSFLDTPEALLLGELASRRRDREVDCFMNYLLILAYDGTNYCGFQVQPNGRSVAQTFQDGLEAVLGSRPDIKGCSRTDAGVHAQIGRAHV